MTAAKKILLVEDNPSLVKVYKQRLEREGFNVIFASGGDEGLRRAKEENPDLVILDLILPEKSGFEVLSDLKSAIETKHIPVLVLTVLEQKKDIDEALRLGAVEYLTKPETPLDDLVENVRKILL